MNNYAFKYDEISMCTFVHTQENVHTWIGFAELAKGSVPPMKIGASYVTEI